MKKNSNIIFNNKTICFYNKKLIKTLKIKAKNSKNKRSRILLHTSLKSQVQEMIIALHKSSDVPAHRHPLNKSESYFIIEGKMKLEIYDKNGKVKKRINMGTINSGKPFYYRMSKGNLWHKPIATSEYCVYHETFAGPFIKSKDVKFNNSTKDKK